MTNRALTKRPRGARRPQGAILILVLLVVGALALAAYAYSETMLTEYRAVRAGTDQMQLDFACESGVEMIRKQMLNQRRGNPPNDSTIMSATEWTDSDGREFTLHFMGQSWQVESSVAKPNMSSVALLLQLNESAKLNVNGLELDREHIESSRQRLLALPGMSASIADAILDWIDPDDEPRPFGVEGAGYAAAGLPYTPRNGAIRSLNELLLVRGVTWHWLYGEDLNCNGWLDPEEDDGSLLSPPDNHDGRLQTGLSRWLTVSSAESNYDGRGNLKVYVNQDTLVTLYKELESRLGEEGARFIVALRMHGPMNDEEVAKFDSEAGIKQRRDNASARLDRQLQKDVSLKPREQAVIRGLSIQTGPVFEVRSVMDLIDRKVEVMIDNKDVILTSPWKANSSQFESSVFLLESQLSCTPGHRDLSRLNVLNAEPEALMTIPGMTREFCGLILQRRANFIRNSQRSLLADLHLTGACSLSQVRAMAPYLTQRGDVLRGYVTADQKGSRQRAAMQFMLDGCGPSVDIVELTKVSAPLVSQTAEGR